MLLYVVPGIVSRFFAGVQSGTNSGGYGIGIPLLYVTFPEAGWCMSKFFLIPPHLGAARPGVKDGILKYPPLRCCWCCWCCCRGFPCPERESSAAAAPTDRPTDRIALRSLHIHIPLVVTAPPSPSFHFSRNLPDVCDGHNVRQRDHDCHGAQLLLSRPHPRLGAGLGADVSRFARIKT